MTRTASQFGQGGRFAPRATAVTRTVVFSSAVSESKEPKSLEP
jgi:hypothetical protein